MTPNGCLQIPYSTLEYQITENCDVFPNQTTEIRRHSFNDLAGKRMTYAYDEGPQINLHFDLTSWTTKHFIETGWLHNHASSMTFLAEFRLRDSDIILPIYLPKSLTTSPSPVHSIPILIRPLSKPVLSQCK